MFICVNNIEIAPKSSSRLPQLHGAVFAKSCNKISMGMVSDTYNFLLMDLPSATENFIISLNKLFLKITASVEKKHTAWEQNTGK